MGQKLWNCYTLFCKFFFKYHLFVFLYAKKNLKLSGCDIDYYVINTQIGENFNDNRGFQWKKKTQIKSQIFLFLKACIFSFKKIEVACCYYYCCYILIFFKLCRCRFTLIWNLIFSLCAISVNIFDIFGTKTKQKKKKFKETLIWAAQRFQIKGK